MKYWYFSILLGVVFTPAFGFFPIEDLDYNDSPYENKNMPSIGESIRLFYQVSNNTPQKNNYEITISITNLDENKQVYNTKHNYDIKSGEFEDIIWNFTPKTSGLYSVAIENSGKTAKYVFAVPKDEEFRQMAKSNSAILEGKSPLQQFRMGLDPKMIKCKEDLYFSLRPSSLPVCTSLETLKELLQRNFIIPEFIEYDRIGFEYSEYEFKKLLDEKNIQHISDNFLLITGSSDLSLPPTTEYCGFVQDETKEDYWFSSIYHWDTITNVKFYDENPMPCEPNNYSCFCSLQTLLTEKNLEKLSYFDESQEKQVGTILVNYLNEGGKITNVPNSFVIGKYNLEMTPDVISFCGQFQGKSYWYFLGYIKDSNIINWGLEMEKPKLCAINENPQKFTFNESAIVTDSFTGQ